MTRVVAAVVCALLAGLTPPSGAAQGIATEGAPFLVLPIGAQAISLGRATTAMPGQESAFWNPAGLARLDDSRILLLHSETVVGTSTGVSALFARPGVGSVGVSYVLWDMGEIEARDANNNLVGSESLRNHLAVVSASARLLEGMDAGVNLKLVQFRRTCRGACGSAATRASTFAVDAGFQMVPSRRVPLRVGAMVAHLGPRFQHENAEQADPLPTRLRVAVAYDVFEHLGDREDLEGWVTVEVQERTASPGSPAVYVGSEIAAGRTDRLFLRAGYIATDPDQVNGASVGFGVRLRNFELAVAKSLAVSGMTGDTEPITVALSIGF